MSYFSPLLNPATRNQPSGIAGLYACKTILNEHRPVCSYEASLYGKYLDVTDNPDVWFPLAGAGTITYSTRNLTLASVAGTATNTRAVINTTAYPIAGNFLECTCKFVLGSVGSGGTVRKRAFGFASAFSGFPATERAIYYTDEAGNSYIGFRGGQVALSGLPIGRNFAAGDIATVRLDREEGDANISIARFYINGQKQYETANIPQVNVYSGIGVYTSAGTATLTRLKIDYFGFKYVP